MINDYLSLSNYRQDLVSLEDLQNTLMRGSLAADTAHQILDSYNTERDLQNMLIRGSLAADTAH